MGAVSSVLAAAQSTNRELLGDTLQNRISLRILRKAAGLELSQFEDAATYDTLQNAYREVGLSPHTYQARLRLARAKALLRQGLSAAQAALEVGVYD